MRPTPIHQWNLAGVPADFRLSIKRDDMTGITLTGNKVRPAQKMAESHVQLSLGIQVKPLRRKTLFSPTLTENSI